MYCVRRKRRGKAEEKALMFKHWLYTLRFRSTLSFAILVLDLFSRGRSHRTTDSTSSASSDKSDSSSGNKFYQDLKTQEYVNRLLLEQKKMQKQQRNYDSILNNAGREEKEGKVKIMKRIPYMLFDEL